MTGLQVRVAVAAICIGFALASAPVLAAASQAQKERIKADPRRNSASANMARESFVPDERRSSAGATMSREGHWPDPRRSSSGTTMAREPSPAADRFAQAAPAPRARPADGESAAALNPQLDADRVYAIRKALRADK